MENRQRVVVCGIELEDGAVVIGAATGGRPVEVAQGIGEERSVRVRSVDAVERVEGRQGIVVRGVEFEDGTVVGAT